MQPYNIAGKGNDALKKYNSPKGDITIPHFFIWRPIQDIGVMKFGSKPLISPKNFKLSIVIKI